MAHDSASLHHYIKKTNFDNYKEIGVGEQIVAKKAA